MTIVQNKLSKASKKGSLFDQIYDDALGICFDSTYKVKNGEVNTSFTQTTYISNEMGNELLNVLDGANGDKKIISLSTDSRLAIHASVFDKLSPEMKSALEGKYTKSGSGYIFKVKRTLRSQSKITKFNIEGTDFYINIDAKNISLSSNSAEGTVKQIYQPENPTATFNFQINPELTKMMLDPKKPEFGFVGTNDKDFKKSEKLLAALDPKEILAYAKLGEEVSPNVRIFNKDRMPQILLTQIVDRDKEVQNILALKFGPGEVYILGNFNDKTNFQRVLTLSIVKSVDTATNNLNCELVINPYVSPSSKNCSLGIETQIPSPTTGSKKGYVNDLSKSQVDQNIAAMQALSDFVGTSAVSKIRTNTFDSSYQLWFTQDNSVGKKKFSSDNKYQDFATTATEKEVQGPDKGPIDTNPKDPDKGPEEEKVDPTTETTEINTVFVDPGVEPEKEVETEKEVKPVETEKKPEEEKEPTTPPVSPVPPTPETESSESRSGEIPGDGVGITAGGGPGGGSSGPSSETGDTIIVPPPAGPSTPSTPSTPTEEHEDGKTVAAASTEDGKPDKPAKAKDKEKSAPAPSKGKDKKESILGPLGFILIAAAVFLCLLAPFLAMSTFAFAGIVVGCVGGACMAAENARFNPTRDYDESVIKARAEKVKEDKEVDKVLSAYKERNQLKEKDSLKRKESTRLSELENGLNEVCSKISPNVLKKLLEKLPEDERKDFLKEYESILLSNKEYDVNDIQEVIDSFNKDTSSTLETPTSEVASEIGTPAVEPYVVEETPVIEEAPATEEAPVIEETPATEETPTIEETPDVEETPYVAPDPDVPVPERTATEEESSEIAGHGEHYVVEDESVIEVDSFFSDLSKSLEEKSDKTDDKSDKTDDKGKE